MNTSEKSLSVKVSFRQIQASDNAVMAGIIRRALEEFGENKPGTVYTDPTTDDLFQLFKKDGSIYLLAEQEGKVLGGCGIYPTKGLPKGYAELVKLYVSAENRGAGVGKQLMERCISWAKENGYTHLYLESIPVLNKAVVLYEAVGFECIAHRLGESGHFACDLWMVKSL
jgi:putative acetyltransferase